MSITPEQEAILAKHFYVRERRPCDEADMQGYHFEDSDRFVIRDGGGAFQGATSTLEYAERDASRHGVVLHRLQ
ncbi:hypothetical protein COU16_02820 [Candidatus Kaiserbacteria bacterium CG10_big_fil_rev_8_21_14_0_10_47_16]|uniref:Uncharacterized protein n=1 Tax=Candidatus Kaiserbacteria bacterium CG10_big_fil_rev_8_21_14_0_10_47_16 TaxID=1974608 RepID=A0A2H0UFN5_9BACT|nr:MAG: hypothetical protein COU16_02820 [Candidatus Kaiserbacteria bacterium CG10_big_fil_rev_8_21_14_0_10_47_16]